ncbi:Nuclear transport factor 2 [Mycena venus]|uniref:Nuclear transport factor 2 n=1 Tax=Mycena venus TaxID=2733690 RepID=A0A8H7CBR2_9AGAR|nr:Nuclear transport factor 2 [Mycena venus]
MSKPPLVLVSRYRPSPRRPRRAAHLWLPLRPPPRAAFSLPSPACPSLSSQKRGLPSSRHPNYRCTPFFRAATSSTPAPVEPKPQAATALKSTSTAPVPATKKSSLTRVSPPKAKDPPPEAAELAVIEEPPAIPPVYSYKTLTPAPKLKFARTDAEADKWVGELDLTGPLSVDFEWIVVYRKGGIRPISLVQIADARSIVVVQLRSSASTMARFPLALQRVLEDPAVPKAGANIVADAKKLFKDYGVMMAGLVELGTLARLADPTSTDAKVFGSGRKIVALAKLVERYLHKTLRKDSDVRVSNWEDPALEKNETQIEYAANDAYCGLQVYNRLVALAKKNDISLDITSNASRVYHACLAPPPSSSSTSTTTASTSASTEREGADSALPPIPTIFLTPAMEAAGVSPQHLRAYRHWLAHRDIDTMCAELALRKGPRGTSATSSNSSRSNSDMAAAPTPLTRGTIVTYVVSAVKNWPQLECDLGRLRLFIQMDLKSWERHYEWVVNVGRIA